MSLDINNSHETTNNPRYPLEIWTSQVTYQEHIHDADGRCLGIVNEDNRNLLNYNPHLPCDVQGGHQWGRPIRATNKDGSVMLIVCDNCGKVRSV